MFFWKLYFTSNGHAKTIISRCAYVIIWCPECWKWHFRASRFQNFLGEHAPSSYSRLFFFNQLPTSNFIETPAYWKIPLPKLSNCPLTVSVKTIIYSTQIKFDFWTPQLTFQLWILLPFIHRNHTDFPWLSMTHT